jgi:hypothetical protein
MTAEIVKVPFHGDEITVLAEGEDQWLPLRPMCERFGVSMQGQLEKLKEAEWACVKEIFTQIPGDDQGRSIACLHLRSFAGWLFSMKPGKVKPEVRAALVAYQREAADALYHHFAPKPAPEAPALPAADVARLVRVESELAEVKGLLLKLAARPLDTYPGRVVGPKEASCTIQGPLRSLARQLAHVRERPYRSVLLTLDRRLRKLVGYPNDHGQGWAMLPVEKYGDVTNHLGVLQVEARAELKEHAAKIARERQLTIDTAA